MREKLGESDFSQVAQQVPVINELIGGAPKSSGLGSALGGLASIIGGDFSKLGNIASLASGFSELGLDSGMVGKFIPIILSFVQSKGGIRLSSGDQGWSRKTVIVVLLPLFYLRLSVF